VALLNAGAMRLDDVIPAGPVSNYQLESIFLFADETRIVTFPLSGGRLRQVLEHGVSDASLGKGGFLQAAGVGFTYDRSRPSADRLVGDLRRPDGGVIAAGDTVEVAMAAYPACEGGDGYRIPEAETSCAQAASGPRAADLLIRYLADSLGGKITPPPGGRIVEAGSPPG
jgi:5'-nucleotidase